MVMVIVIVVVIVIVLVMVIVTRLHSIRTERATSPAPAQGWGVGFKQVARCLDTHERLVGQRCVIVQRYP